MLDQILGRDGSQLVDKAIGQFKSIRDTLVEGLGKVDEEAQKHKFAIEAEEAKFEAFKEAKEDAIGVLDAKTAEGTRFLKKLEEFLGY